ncbi:MAG: FecR domain-containing protein, partial [Gemmatimonadales bacterium]
MTALSGQATITRATLPQSLPLKFKDDVFLRDRISTAEKSLVRVLLGGKALVTVRELSVLTITEEVGRATVGLDRGLIGMVVARQRLRPGETLEIRTPNAIAAVRGTVLVVEVTGAQTAQLTATATLTTTVSVLSGSVDVSPLDAPSASVRVGTLETVSVTGNTVGQVRPVPPATVTQLNEMLKAPIQHPDTPKEGQNQVVQNQVGNATFLANLLTGQSGAAAPTAPQAEAQDPLLVEASSPMASQATSTGTAAATTDVTTTSPTASQAPVVSTTQATPQVQAAVAPPPPPSSALGSGVGNPPLVIIDPSSFAQTVPLAQVSAGGSTAILSPDPSIFTPSNPLVLSNLSSSPGTVLNATAAHGETVALPGGVGLLDTNITVSGTPVFSVNGASATIGGSAVILQNSSISGASMILDVTGGASLTSTSAAPLVFADTSAISTSTLVAIGLGSILFLNGPPLMQNGGTAAIGMLVDVAAGGTLDLQADVAIAGSAGVSNAGTIVKSAGTGTASISTPLTNTGTVDVQSGTLQLAGGGTHTGSFAGTGTLDFAGGTHTLQAGS